MTHLFRYACMSMLMCLAFAGHAATTWIPISSSDITVIIPFVPSESFSAPSDLSFSSKGSVQRLNWQDIEHASRYEVQAKTSDGTWVTIAITDLNYIDLDSRFSSYSTARVIACNYNSCVNAGTWSTEIIIATTESNITYKYNALGRLYKVVDSVNSDREYEYDDAGNRKKVKEVTND